MSGSRVRAERPRGAPSGTPEPILDRDALAGYEEDAARVRGRGTGLFRPGSEAEVAAILSRATREGVPLVVQGARSSLTGGATPRDEWVLSTERLARLVELRPEGVARAEPGLRLRDLVEAARAHALFFPPVPTYDLCCLGGAVATNAAGAATFKYGSVRGFVRALRVVLAWGDAIALRRGEVLADATGAFEVERTDGTLVRVPRPAWETPPIKKVSSGWFSREGMDLVDLFVGAEGTLGVVTEVEVALAPAPACVVAGLAALPAEDAALAFAADVRAASEATWRARDPRGIDVRAIEYVDAASFDLLRARGKTTLAPLPDPGRCAVIWEQELASSLSADEAAEALGRGLAAGGEGPLERLGALLARHGGGEDAFVALPGDEASRRRIQAVREAVPEAVNELVAERKRSDAGVKKVATDMCVPPDRLREWLLAARASLARRGLGHVAFGHVSDGNLHVNVLARSAAEARAGEDAVLEAGDLARALGGAPLAEHGVGKSPLKQELLRRFYGDAALRSAAATKRALDPALVLARGNVIPWELLAAPGSRGP